AGRGWFQNKARFADPARLPGKRTMGGEMHNGILLEAPRIGQILEVGLSRLTAEQDLALRHSEPAADFTKLVRRLGQWNELTDKLDVGVVTGHDRIGITDTARAAHLRGRQTRRLVAAALVARRERLLLEIVAPLSVALLAIEQWIANAEIAGVGPAGCREQSQCLERCHRRYHGNGLTDAQPGCLAIVGDGLGNLRAR